MSSLRNRCLRAGMQAMRATGSHRLMAPWTEGVGLIFTLHEVNPSPKNDFEPNSILRITPEFLEKSIMHVREAGLQIVSLDEAHRRFKERDFSNRFACFTLDDGYRDNKQFAYPIFKKHDVPFTIYIPSSFPDGDGVLWWLALQQIIANEPAIELLLDREWEELSCADTNKKWQSFNRVYWWLRGKDPLFQVDFVRGLASTYGFDLKKQCQQFIMNWDEVRALNEDPLVTIGAHTVAHEKLSNLSLDGLRKNTETSIAKLEKELGQAPLHISYPYGDERSAGPREFEVMRDFGFKTAVTTRKGVLYEEHVDHLTALPRVSLNGDFQSEDFVSVCLSGAIFALWNGFRKVNVD